MKQLLPFLLALGAGFVLGNRRARKRTPIDQLLIEVKADTSQAVAALDALSKKAQRVTVDIETATLCGKDLVGLVNSARYREMRTS